MTAKPIVRQFLVEELAAGWISGERREELLEQLAAEPGGLDRLDEIARSNERILDQYPPSEIAARIVRSGEAARRSSRPIFRVAVPVLATALAAAVFAWLVVPTEVLRGAGPKGAIALDEERILVKGAPQLIIHRLRGSTTERLRTGASVEAGDLLQLEYNALEASYGVVFSVDGRGFVTLHYPLSVDGSTALEPGGAHALPFSYQLDDAPEFERFFMVWSNQPVPTDAVLAAARKLGPAPTACLALPEGLDSAEHLLKKTTRSHP